MKLFPPHAFCFMGGGGGGGQPLPAVAPPTPPVSPDAQASVATEQSLKRQQLRRKSISSTMYAGATGGWSPQGSGGAGMGANTGQAMAPNVSTGMTKTG